MTSDSPGQFLGSVIQLPRALYRLLLCKQQEAVCVEYLGDVSTLKQNGDLITEEDKSSIVGNPLTNKSTNLWKTFYNWITRIKSGEIQIEKTYFILFANRKGNLGIVNSFNDAINATTAKQAVLDAIETLQDVDSKHEIWNYMDFCLKQNQDILIKLIEKFELQLSDGTGYKEISDELKNMHLPAGQIEYISETLSGWLQKFVVNKIYIGEPAIITWEVFNKKCLPLFENARTRNLIDFTSENLPKGDDILQHVKIRPSYIRQLELIKLPETDILEAVSDFIRATVNRDKWIETEIINEETAADFESKLIKFWTSKSKNIELTENKLEEFERGQLLLNECKVRQELIGGVSPPAVTISGTYHALANTPVLGWHPQWKKSFESEEN